MRPFGWQDLLTLYVYRNQALSLDSARLLTRGSPLGLFSLISHLNPGSGNFTGVAESRRDNATLIGHMYHNQGEKSARLAFILPGQACASGALPSLVEGLAEQAGRWGAFHLLAEVDERDAACDALRCAGFSIYARQSVWQLSVSESNGKETVRCWKPETPLDDIPVRSLYQSLVPPLVQRAEPLSERLAAGSVCRQGGEVVAYVDGIYGPRGIYLQPIIHPASENVAELIRCLPAAAAPRLGRPVYLVVRSYQAWLEPILSELGAQPAPRQALLVRYLTNIQFAPAYARMAALEKAQPETSMPMMSEAEGNGNS